MVAKSSVHLAKMVCLPDHRADGYYQQFATVLFDILVLKERTLAGLVQYLVNTQLPTIGHGQRGCYGRQCAY